MWPAREQNTRGFGGFADEAQEIAIEAVLITRDQRG
jgi:hypothetical protein